MILIGGCGWAGLYVFRDRIGNELAQLAEEAINARLAGSGWSLEIGRAVWMDPCTVRVERLDFVRGGESRSPAISMGPLVIHKENLGELAGGNLMPDLVRLDSCELRIDLGQCRRESLESLLRSLAPREPQLRLPEVSGRDCRILIENRSQSNAQSELFYGIEIQTEASEDEHGRTLCLVRGAARSSRFARGTFRGAVWPAERFVSGRLEIGGVTAGLADLHWIPRQLLEPVGRISMLQAGGDFSLDFSLESGRLQAADWKIAGDVKGLALAAERLPAAVTEARFGFELKPSGVRIHGFQSGFGTAHASGDFAADWVSASVSAPVWRLKGKVDDLTFQSISLDVLPLPVQNLMKQFSPRGLGDLEIELGWDGERFTRQLSANIQDMSFSFYRLPYALEHCVGSAVWRGDDCRFAVQSLDGGQIIDVGGWIRSPGPDATFQIDFGCRGELPIDEKLLRSLEQYPQIARQARDLRPRGAIGVRGSFLRDAAGAPPLLDCRIDLKQCQVRHVRFDYPLRDVSGQVLVRGRDVRFQGLRGRNSDAVVQGAGEWTAGNGLQMRFLAEKVSLDSQLKAALPAAAVQAWDAVRPSGTVDVVRTTLMIGPEPGALPVVGITADAAVPESVSDSGLVIRPPSFPWQVSRISAQMSYENGEFSVSGFRGEHGSAWVTARMAGNCRSGGWSLGLRDLIAGGVDVNEELLNALPRSLSSQLQKTRLAGRLQVSGTMDFSSETPTGNSSATGSGSLALVNYETVGNSGALRPGPSRSSAWDIRIDLEDASASLGLPLEHLSGAVYLKGKETDGRFSSTGRMEIDAVSVYGAWLTQLRGPVWIDNGRAAAGTFASDPAQPAEGAAQSLQGLLFGGRFSLDAQVWGEDEGKFYCQTALSGGQLALAAGCLDSGICQTGGTASVDLRCSGICGNTESITGEGSMQLSNARLYELPVMMGVLKSLRKREADRTAFDAGQIEFGLRGEQIDLNRIELNGDTLSLIGNGTMDWHRRIKLDFYSVMGRNRLYIPVLSELYKAGSQEIMWLTVDGTLENPNLGQQILPGINEGLKLLLDPRSRTAHSGAVDPAGR